MTKPPPEALWACITWPLREMRYAPRHHGWGVVRVGTFRIRNDQEANLMKAPGDMDCSDGRARSTVIIDEARRLGHGRNFISYPRRMLLTADANGTKAELGRQSGDHPQRRRSTGSIGVTSHAPRAPSNSGRSLSPCFRHATSGGRALHSRSPTPVSPSSLNRPSRRSLSEGAPYVHPHDVRSWGWTKDKSAGWFQGPHLGGVTG